MDACRTEKVTLLAWLWGQYEEPFASIYKKYTQTPRNQENTDVTIVGKDRVVIAHPNPFTDKILLEGISEIPAQVEIYNSLGHLKLKKKIENDHAQVDLSFLNSGIYFLRIRQRKEVSNVKIVKY